MVATGQRQHTAHRTAHCPVTDKVMYGTRWAADRAVETYEGRYGVLWHAYHCWQCNTWHCGHATLWGSGPLRLVEYALGLTARERAEIIPEQLRALALAGSAGAEE